MRSGNYSMVFLHVPFWLELDVNRHISLQCRSMKWCALPSTTLRNMCVDIVLRSPARPDFAMELILVGNLALSLNFVAGSHSSPPPADVDLCALIRRLRASTGQFRNPELAQKN